MPPSVPHDRHLVCPDEGGVGGDFAAYCSLFDQYRAKFGEAPPILWKSTEEQQQAEVLAMRRAVASGQPWVRTDLDVPAGILI